ncbi:hypothetical protein ACT4S5_01450 [Kocuria oceani]|uniref:hypothetical protein n=1 Tax=Kocuria oceani TaxID=988827 RepID=UPI00403532B4
MNTPTSRALAVELHPHSPAGWMATYYPMVETPAGRWAEVTWTLHQRLLPDPADVPGPARWLEVRSGDPTHPCYAQHRAWAGALAAGYAAALAAHDAEDLEQPLSAQDAERLREGTIVVPAGQLSEWVLDDLQEETTPSHG